jgi:hypothetical protein
MTTVNLSALAGAGQQFFDNNGKPLSGGKLFSYEAGTTTPQVTYTTAAGDVPHTNPIILDSAGRVPGGQIWLIAGADYKFALDTPTNVQIATWDNITGISGTGITTVASSVGFTGFKGQTGTVQNLADDDGSDWIGFEQAGSGAVARSAQEKMREAVSPQDFGAVGDGVTDDTGAFVTLEATYQDRDIDLQGKSYKVATMPNGNRYFDGLWVLPSGTSRVRWQGAQLTGAGRIAFGDGALEDLPIDYSTGSTGTVVAMGYRAMANMTQAKKTIAIGANAQENSLISRDNIAIGDSALKNVQAVTPDYSQTFRQGTRNIGIGGNAGYFISSGYNNTIVGRNTGQCLTGDRDAVAVGANAYAGYAPIGLSREIENWAPTNSAADQRNYSVAIGGQALAPGITDYSVAVGGEALRHNKKSNGNVAVGPQTLRDLDIGTWFNGGLQTTLGIDGTYNQSGTTITLSIVGHTLVPGDIALFRLLDGAAQTFQNDIVPAFVVSTPTADQFTITSPQSLTASGSARLFSKASAAQQPVNEFNTAVGGLAAFQMRTGFENTTAGYRSMNDVTNATRSVAFGFRALSGLTEAINCTAIGHDSLRFMVDGTVATGTGENRTGLGVNTRVSGNNQVQLGNAATTTYAFGAVQDRSDVRDKADVRDTQLGLAFIERLRPVDYKWDYRDDYFIQDEEGNLVPLPKNGSKKRKRFHHGLIAQDVKRVCDELGLDFGGYQDHAVNGGCDVKSIGYTELIAPLIKAVQELSARVKELEAK